MENIKYLLAKDRLERTVKNLKNNDFEVICVDTLEEAEKITIDIIPEGSSISMGGSITLNMTGLLEKFRSEKYKFFERFKQPTWERTVRVMRESLLSDFLVTGTNAVTEEGFLIQIDSGGNRVAGMAYGPHNVIVITGVNKIVKNINEGYKRLYYAGPLNSKRLNHKTPCNFSGKCENCTTEMRMCNFISVIKNGKRVCGKIRVILINDNLGY
ncbi:MULTISPECIES: lactate utilization protein [Fusobacterium]|jgi:L-lactate utilization protein LutB|uniref:lactate utilization protein n=1 Tax=Fusobacterium TaxID=848 RepID=UPI0015A1F277|nr:lactate utilization protein [Fusobacterium ulcerans]